MRTLTTIPYLVCALTCCVPQAKADVYPGYCTELLPAAGYTFTGQVTITPNGLLHITTTEEELVIGEYTFGEAAWEQLRLIRTRATETHLAEKATHVYLIGQIDMMASEPFCARTQLD